MRRNITKKLFLAGFGLLLGLVLAEVMLRVHATVEARRVPAKQFRTETAGAGTIRMAVLGGSTSNGSPYSNAMKEMPDQNFNLLSITRFLLEKRCGYRAVNIDSYAGPNWSAETTIDHYFERPGPKPDVLVLYTGQNESTQYYSPNMTPPPAFLTPLARLASGNLVLRRLFTRQVTPADQRYTGKFFSDNVIPAYEREHNLARYRRYVRRMIRHARDEGIFLVIVIPQSNYLFPPTRSVYAGPADRKADALRLFKEAWQARYLENNPARTTALLEQLREFCEFADLYYELGRLHYSRGEFDKALPYLRRARETDGFPICITPAYRQVLHDLVREHDVPCIDMDTVIRESLGRPVPDYATFLDDCHLYPAVYLELSRELIGAMREHGFDRLGLPPGGLRMTSEELANDLGITTAIWLDSLLWEANYHVGQADYTFLKLGGLTQARNYLLKIREQVHKPLPNQLVEDFETMGRLIQAELERMQKWVQHDGPMPIGLPADDVPEAEFGGGAVLEASQGDAMMAHGEAELAIAHYRAALAIDPGNLGAQINLGAALVTMQRFEEAIDHYERVVEMEPRDVIVRRNLGVALFELRRFEGALVHLREAVSLAPDDRDVLSDYCAAASALAWQLATSPDATVRDGKRAVGLAEEVCRITGNKAFETLDALAAAYAETGRFEEAVPVATRALELARHHSNPRADAIALRLALYKVGRPWRQEE